LFHEELDNVEVVPLSVRRSDLPCPDAQIGGQLRGRLDVLKFIRDIQLDSVVATKQLSDLPAPAFQFTFHLLASEEIVTQLEARFRQRTDEYIRILSGDQLPERDEAVFAPFESAVLGASELAIATVYGESGNGMASRPSAPTA